MTIYKFFKIPKDCDNDTYDLESKYELYAITNNKEMAERFKEDRNMKKFIYKKDKHVTKEEYAEICNNNRGALLSYQPLTTTFGPKIHSNIQSYDVLMTYFEKQLINEPDTLLDNEQYWAEMPYPLIFKSKYIKCLSRLEYITFYRLMTAEFLPFHLSEKMSKIDGDDYSAPAVSYDELALFIGIIKDTL